MNTDVLEKNRKETYKEKYGFADKDSFVYRTQRGLSSDIVKEISGLKGEPAWMLDFRLKSLETFYKKPMPAFGGDLSKLNFDDIYYYIKPGERKGRTWDEVPEKVKNTFEKLGIPEAERKFLAGVEAQYDSESVYSSLKGQWEKLGVIFCSTDEALKNHPDILRKYFGTLIPPADNKFSALNSAVWSGGSFIYIPAGVHVDIPLQAYFRINSESAGQFERTLIIAEPGSFVHYVEGCTAPVYAVDALHSAVVEIIIKEGARVRYTTIQNWSDNVYNLVTKRAAAYKDATMEWVDGNIGSKLTMKYPAIYLMDKGAHGEVLSVAYASDGQHQDTGGKAIHYAPHTSSIITSKSISKGTGRASYRGLVKVYKGAKNVKSSVKCDALLLDDTARSDTYPKIEIDEEEVQIGHEATVSKVGEEQLFYLRSRGLSEEQATAMIVSGFIEPIVRELPMEYAVELNRLISMEMEGSVG
ncbi:MAG: Fe-S cluster assembly protein SufB [Bacteroidota bacterium]|nr:Fe-S cluster assembly protein SufB [Bacteroidota bacterium]